MVYKSIDELVADAKAYAKAHNCSERWIEAALKQLEADRDWEKMMQIAEERERESR